jgi:uncharacterized membrane protein HdeD (DUF308 family)
VALETMDLTGKLCGGRIQPAFALTWGPYAFFVSGLLQFVVGLWEVTRNNIYGATAFLAFGSFWLANGTILILTTYFPTEIDEALLVADPWGKCIRNLYILAFVCVLFKQTLVMTKLTSTLIGLLSVLMLATSFGGWSEEIEWIQMISGWLVSVSQRRFNSCGRRETPEGWAEPEIIVVLSARRTTMWVWKKVSMNFELFGLSFHASVLLKKLFHAELVVVQTERFLWKMEVSVCFSDGINYSPFNTLFPNSIRAQWHI